MARAGVSSKSSADEELDEVVDELVRASRVLVSVAARSLGDVNETVTLPQFRALVLLAGRGRVTAGALAELLGVHASTLTRLADRLAAKGLITREVSPVNRREVVLGLTARGRGRVRSVTARRRREIRAIAERMTKPQRDLVVRALGAFGDAAGELTESSWLPGWSGE